MFLFICTAPFGLYFVSRSSFRFIAGRRFVLFVKSQEVPNKLETSFRQYYRDRPDIAGRVRR